jgi:hypothetical protein
MKVMRQSRSTSKTLSVVLSRIAADRCSAEETACMTRECRAASCRLFTRRASVHPSATAGITPTIPPVKTVQKVMVCSNAAEREITLTALVCLSDQDLARGIFVWLIGS